MTAVSSAHISCHMLRAKSQKRMNENETDPCRAWFHSVLALLTYEDNLFCVFVCAFPSFNIQVMSRGLRLTLPFTNSLLYTNLWFYYNISRLFFGTNKQNKQSKLDWLIIFLLFLFLIGRISRIGSTSLFCRFPFRSKPAEKKTTNKRLQLLGT